MKTLIYTIFVLTIVSCSQSVPEGNDSAAKSFKSETNELSSTGTLINPRDLFTILTSKDTVLETSKLSRIHISKGSFEHLDGSKCGNKVRVEFNEYQTSGEILASGLPMTYKDQKGKEMDFESAGMFEIRAYEGKEELRLKKDKEVKVELATPTDGMYNFYQLNDNTRAWKEEATNLRPIPNPYLDAVNKEQKSLDTLKSEKPKKLVSYKPSDQLLDIKANLRTYPEFREIPGAMWKYMGDDAAKDPSKNGANFSKTYAFVSLKPTEGNEYVFDVQFVAGKDTVEFTMAPVFTGKLKSKGEKLFRERLQKFAEVTKEKERLRNQARRESELLRVFNLDKLGVYNYDRQYKDEDAIPILAEFTFGDKLHADAKEMHVFLVPKQKLVVVKYDIESASQFRINLHETNRLIAVDGEGTVYALSDSEIDAYQLSQKKGQKVVFKLKKLNQKAKTSADVDQVLASL